MVYQHGLINYLLVFFWSLILVYFSWRDKLHSQSHSQSTLTSILWMLTLRSALRARSTLCCITLSCSIIQSTISEWCGSRSGENFSFNHAYTRTTFPLHWTVISWWFLNLANILQHLYTTSGSQATSNHATHIYSKIGWTVCGKANFQPQAHTWHIQAQQSR